MPNERELPEKMAEMITDLREKNTAYRKAMDDEKAAQEAAAEASKRRLKARDLADKAWTDLSMWLRGEYDLQAPGGDSWM